MNKTCFSFFASHHKILLALAFILGLVFTDKSLADSHKASYYPITIKSALGSATIVKQPKNIVALGEASEDILLSLDIIPIAIESKSLGTTNGLYPWIIDSLKAKNAKPVMIDNLSELNLEKILALKPDLILAPYSALSQQDFNKLSQFAPTIAYPSEPWQITTSQQIRLIAKALNRQKDGEKMIKEIEHIFADSAKRLHNQDKYKFAYIKGGVGNHNLALYSTRRPRVGNLLRLNMQPIDYVTNELYKSKKLQILLNLEHSDILNQADILIALFGSESKKAQTEEEPLFRQLRAIKNGLYIPLYSTQDKALLWAIAYATPLSLKWGLPIFEQKFNKIVMDYENNNKGISHNGQHHK